MEAEKRPNLAIIGSGSASGGNYQRAKITGDGIIHGNLECGRLSLMGNAEIDGVLKASKATICGQLDISGDASAGFLKLAGTLRGNKNYSGEEVSAYGEFYIEGDCEVERFNLKGAVSAGGMLNAGTVDIRLIFGNSTVKEIGGGSIVIRRSSMFSLRKLLKPFLPGHEQLTAETIEGDNIYLEYTKAHTVRGGNVRIGPGCEIERVEYKNRLLQAKEAKVNHQAKV